MLWYVLRHKIHAFFTKGLTFLSIQIYKNISTLSYITVIVLGVLFCKFYRLIFPRLKVRMSVKPETQAGVFQIDGFALSTLQNISVSIKIKNKNVESS